MTSNALVKRVIRYTVLSLDMWGHVSADCAAHGCPCIDPETTEHDDNACECHEDTNDQHRIGEIQVCEGASDAELIQTLIDDGFIDEDRRENAIVDDYSDGSTLDINDREGRRVYHLIAIEDCDA